MLRELLGAGAGHGRDINADIFEVADERLKLIEILGAHRTVPPAVHDDHHPGAVDGFG